MPHDSDLDSTVRVGATGRLLREYLTANSRYRRRWQAKARRVRASDVSQAAVAEVLAEYLWDIGERSDRQTSLARDLKDRVRRALSGITLSSETLEWFIGAFCLDDEDASRLWETFTGDVTPATGIKHTMTNSREMVRRQRHRTLSLFERYRIAADGSLLERHTWQTIGAKEDGVSGYLFNHEPYAQQVRIVHGGRLGEQFRYGHGLRSQDIILDHPLRRGETTSLEYVTGYPPGSDRICEVRRPARGRSENIDIAVEFHTARLPAAVYWCVWTDHLDGAPIREERVALNDAIARRFVPFVEQAVVGFRWLW